LLLLDEEPTSAGRPKREASLKAEKLFQDLVVKDEYEGVYDPDPAQDDDLNDWQESCINI
jgi:hypothetical protein